MTVELRPLGVRCNLQCQYCYQNPQRDAGNLSREYDLRAMKAAILAEGGPFSLFGGEPLLVPEEDLEDLWAWGLKQYGHNGIQTNGALINDAHIRLFKSYKVHVGISIDGPNELNNARWQGTLEGTLRATARTEQAIARLCAEGMPPSLIVTLNRVNASPERLPILLDWVRGLESIGIRSIRLHLLEVESAAVRAKYALTTTENLDALLGFMALAEERPGLGIDLFADMRALLLGRDNRTTCVWNACDPYTTRAVRGVEGQGQRSNCGRTNKDGIDFVKSDTPGYERYLALYMTPQAAGGCAGCRFFLMCKGQCPGTAIDGDWRNRSEHCETWKTLFEKLERQLISAGEHPLSVSEEREDIEQDMLDAWTQGEAPSIQQLISARSRPTESETEIDWRLEVRRTLEDLRRMRREYAEAQRA